jgi:hypothetical protein
MRNRTFITLFVLLLATLAGGCTMAPKSQRPDAPITTTYGQTFGGGWNDEQQPVVIAAAGR